MPVKKRPISGFLYKIKEKIKKFLRLLKSLFVKQENNEDEYIPLTSIFSESSDESDNEGNIRQILNEQRFQLNGNNIQLDRDERSYQIDRADEQSFSNNYLHGVLVPKTPFDNSNEFEPDD